MQWKLVELLHLTFANYLTFAKTNTKPYCSPWIFNSVLDKGRRLFTQIYFLPDHLQLFIKIQLPWEVAGLNLWQRIDTNGIVPRPSDGSNSGGQYLRLLNFVPYLNKAIPHKRQQTKAWYIHGTILISIKSSYKHYYSFFIARPTPLPNWHVSQK